MRTNNGAIQISRSIFDSKIWSKPSDWIKIWLYILGNVNYGDTNRFKRGENFFKYEIIALECGCSINVVNNCIKFLKEAEQIQNIKTSRGAIISVINYDKYQNLDNYGRTRTEQRQNKDRTSTNTIKEKGKEIKKEKNNNINIIIEEQEKGNFSPIIKITLQDKIKSELTPGLFTDFGKDILLQELESFVNHWTEERTLRNGTIKQKWEEEKFFEINKRFRTWLNNTKKWSKSENKKSYKVTTI